MVAVWQPPGQQTFFLTKIDINGNPYTVPNTGGFVYMYEPGSTVPKTTWLDSGQSTANTSPIRLDPQGRCIIYGVGQYRQIVTDAHGNEEWDQLTELGIDTTFLTDTLLNDPVLVDGPNPNPPLDNPDQGTRSLSAVLGSFVDARNGRFGALRQSGNDLATIQNAIDYAHSIGGATVYLGPGPLTTTSLSQLKWPSGAVGVSLRGDGGSTILNIQGTATIDIFDLTAPGIASCQIRDMAFSVPDAAPVGGAMIHAIDPFALSLEDLQMNGGFYRGIYIEGGPVSFNNGIIRNVFFFAATNAFDGIELGGLTAGSAIKNLIIENCQVNGARYGVLMRAVERLTASSLTLSNQSINGVALETFPLTTIREVQLTDVSADGSGSQAFSIQGAGGLIEAVTLTNCRALGSAIGIIMGALPADSTINIADCQVSENLHEGIVNLGAAGVIINGCMLVGNGRAAANSYDAISIVSGVRNIIVNNYITSAPGGQQRYGILLGGPTDNCVVMGNVTVGGGTGSINNASTGIANVVTNNTGN